MIKDKNTKIEISSKQNFVKQNPVNSISKPPVIKPQPTEKNKKEK